MHLDNPLRPNSVPYPPPPPFKGSFASQQHQAFPFTSFKLECCAGQGGKEEAGAAAAGAVHHAHQTESGSKREGELQP